MECISVLKLNMENIKSLQFEICLEIGVYLCIKLPKT